MRLPEIPWGSRQCQWSAPMTRSAGIDLRGSSPSTCGRGVSNMLAVSTPRPRQREDSLRLAPAESTPWALIGGPETFGDGMVRAILLGDLREGCCGMLGRRWNTGAPLERRHVADIPPFRVSLLAGAFRPEGPQPAHPTDPCCSVPARTTAARPPHRPPTQPGGGPRTRELRGPPSRYSPPEKPHALCPVTRLTRSRAASDISLTSPPIPHEAKVVAAVKRLWAMRSRRVSRLHQMHSERLGMSSEGGHAPAKGWENRPSRLPAARPGTHGRSASARWFRPTRAHRTPAPGKRRAPGPLGRWAPSQLGTGGTPSAYVIPTGNSRKTDVARIPGAVGRPQSTRDPMSRVPRDTG